MEWVKWKAASERMMSSTNCNGECVLSGSSRVTSNMRFRRRQLTNAVQWTGNRDLPYLHRVKSRPKATCVDEPMHMMTQAPMHFLLLWN